MAEQLKIKNVVLNEDAKLKDVPSGVEAATLCDQSAAPEYTKNSINCKKMTWILEDTPRIELDFGEDHKKFKFQVASSDFDLFRTAKDFKFERTETDTIFTIKKTERNPSSRMSILEEYTRKYLNLLQVEKFEVRFNELLKYDFFECFIWKITRKFSSIYYSSHHDVTFTPGQLRFLLEDLTAENFRLPRIKYTDVIKAGEKNVEPIKHENMNIHAEFLPFDYFLKMESKIALIHTDNTKMSNLNGFIKTWIKGQQLKNLQSFSMRFWKLKENLTVDEVFQGIVPIEPVSE
ncbi:hypothetical protein CRE_07592 [Caenorhabditis remanei]|nr:hypothetical protein CRE_07592 [Caenorhabditis remanei]